MQRSGIRLSPIGHLGLPPTTLSLLKMKSRIIISKSTTKKKVMSMNQMRMKDPTGEQLYIQLSITILMRMKDLSMKKKKKDVMIYTIRPTQLKGPALGSLKQEINHPSYL